jgi:hypothetical protein
MIIIFQTAIYPPIQPTPTTPLSKLIRALNNQHLKAPALTKQAHQLVTITPSVPTPRHSNRPVPIPKPATRRPTKQLVTFRRLVKVNSYLFNLKIELELELKIELNEDKK